MKLKIVDAGSGKVVFEEQNFSSVSLVVEDGGVVAYGGKASAAATGSAPEGTIPFGKDKGKPIAGASIKTLEFLKKYCDDALANPDKERFRESNEAMLLSVLAEMKRQGADIPF